MIIYRLIVGVSEKLSETRRVRLGVPNTADLSTYTSTKVQSVERSSVWRTQRPPGATRKYVVPLRRT